MGCVVQVRLTQKEEDGGYQNIKYMQRIKYKIYAKNKT
jgi:hypothetical protein